MPCSACARRRKKAEAEKQRRKARGQKIVPAIIDGGLKLIDMVAGNEVSKRELPDSHETEAGIKGTDGPVHSATGEETAR